MFLDLNQHHFPLRGNFKYLADELLPKRIPASRRPHLERWNYRGLVANPQSGFRIRCSGSRYRKAVSALEAKTSGGSTLGLSTSMTSIVPASSDASSKTRTSTLGNVHSYSVSSTDVQSGSHPVDSLYHEGQTPDCHFQSLSLFGHRDLDLGISTLWIVLLAHKTSPHGIIELDKRHPCMLQGQHILTQHPGHLLNQVSL